jgi:hypothetical protein
MVKLCVGCGKETCNPKFCSRSCAASFTNKVSPKRKITRKCTRCDSLIRNYRSKLCEKHFQEYKSTTAEEAGKRTLGEYRSKDCLKALHPSSRHAHIRGLARNKYSDLAKSPCHNCGYKLHVEICHIKAVSSFGNDATVNEVNHEDNIVQLCRNCHWEFDKGILVLNDRDRNRT